MVVVWFGGWLWHGLCGCADCLRLSVVVDDFLFVVAVCSGG